MNPAQARERSQFQSIQQVAEGVLELSKGMNALDTALQREERVAPEVLRQELQSSMESLRYGNKGLALYVDHCERRHFEGLARSGKELLHHLESIQTDMRSVTSSPFSFLEF